MHQRFGITNNSGWMVMDNAESQLGFRLPFLAAIMMPGS